MDFTIKDDIGNVYGGTNFGGRGFPNDISTGKTLEKIDERAKTLTIVPHVRLTKSSENDGEQPFGESVVSNGTTEVADYKETTLAPIVINLQK
ncbi:hypothetical protein C7Y47_16290 [Lysinibacillus sphaericus]|uniref:Uncharacterized protein n=1 Tax=Lysinibacillus sphaericus TaxID=1421 RepID=A0A544UCL3_LYSSH|nr:DUF5643 domain-containing protein [Lysinibacillus sp. SDF0037]TQR30047.1 hypothetical protein C7Y47_16290 [Lysinibacillus sp. SDF0037]